MIDKDYLKNNLGCDDEFLELLFEQFVAECKESTTLMNKSLESEQWDVVKGSAHKMLSSTRLFNMPELSEMLEKIELYAGQESNLDEVKELVSRFNSGIELTYEEIKCI